MHSEPMAPPTVNSSKNKQHLQQWRDGLWDRNPALVMLLGLCPLLAVSNSFINGAALAAATLITLCLSNTLIAALRQHIIASVRIPMAVLIIAGTVTAIEQLMAAYMPGMHRSLGIFLPLIVTNCLILGRAEVYARHHSVLDALLDALIMGIGFALVLMLLGAIRQWLGQGLLIALLPPGAFITLGCLLAAKNAIDLFRTKKKQT